MWLVEEGTKPALKNFRKGLRHQWERCQREREEAEKAGDTATVNAALDRLRWIRTKQAALDDNGEMIFDRPVIVSGRQKPFGSLGPDAVRSLSAQEVRWNRELIRAEADFVGVIGRRNQNDMKDKTKKVAKKDDAKDDAKDDSLGTRLQQPTRETRLKRTYTTDGTEGQPKKTKTA